MAIDQTPTIFQDEDERKGRTYLYWLAIALSILVIDYNTGPFIQFPIWFVLPVALASWYEGKWWGMAYAIGLPLVRLYFNTIWKIPWTLVEGSINALIRIAMLCLLVYLVDRVAKETKAAKTRVKVLEGLLPICVSCKKIRDDENTWQPFEVYIGERSDAKFTHGVCPECAKKLYGVDLPPPTKKVRQQ
jgi:hypothetical protein